MVRTFEKRREPAKAGSIPEALDMFRAEVRFYREIAPVVGVRVPVCIEAEDTSEGTRLLLEDLSSWTPGADPVPMARELAALHRRWEGHALDRWPWLRGKGAAADLISSLFEEVWPRLRSRSDLTPEAASLGTRAIGGVEDLEAAGAAAQPCTLCHGDASFNNVFTGPGGEIAFTDWEDVGWAPGVTDLAWLLVSSVPPGRWDEVIRAYGPARGLNLELPAAGMQGLLTLGDLPEGGVEARGWVERLTEAARRLMAG